MRFAFSVFTTIWRHRALTRMRAFRISAGCFLMLAPTVIGRPAQATDLWVGAYPPPLDEVFCAECIRDAIYADTKLIAHLEANPDVDEAFKGPIVLAARADVQRLRKILGPGERISAAPCCYFRKRLYVR
jgi:hypothetical protein